MKHLTHEEAIYRKSVLSNITYDVKLALIKGKTYFGTTKINFVYKASNSTKQQPLFIDYHGDKIQKLKINGKMAGN